MCVCGGGEPDGLSIQVIIFEPLKGKPRHGEWDPEMEAWSEIS